jgi:hypothetical protein
VLEDVKPSEKEIRINGVGGYQMTVKSTGHLPNFFEVYCSPEVKVNVLCFAEVEDLFEVEYREKEGFTVRLQNGKEILFARRNKMFVAKVEDVASVLATIAEKKTQYSTAEVKKAEVAYELLKNAGYPSAAELINLLGDGNVLDMPALTRSDVVRAYEIFGQSPEYVRGKLTKKKVGRVNFDVALRSQEPQTLWSDVMHIDQQLFFVSVADPMQLILLNHIKIEDAESLGEALQDQLGVLHERSYEPNMVYVDPASGLMSLRTQFPGVVIDPCGAGDFVSKIDVRIRRLKEMYRAVKAGLPWMLPKSRVKDLMTYCVSRKNLRRTSALDGTVCPKVLFTGIKPNYRKELLLAFGDYVEVHTGTDNTSRERSVPCIALYPVGNTTGTWQFWNLRTKRYMRHSTWVKMRSSELITDIINNIAENERDPAGEDHPEPSTIIREEEVDEDPKVDEEKIEDKSEETSVQVEEEQKSPETGGQPVCRSERIAAGIQLPERYAYASFVGKERWLEDKAKEAIKGEVSQLFKELKALQPVKKESIVAGACILTCHMFLVEKFLASGEFDKVKARLVSHGNKQDRSQFPDRSSPTVAIHSVMMVLALFAGNMGQHAVSKINVKGAFIQTPMEGDPIYLRIGGDIVKYIIEEFPSYKEFVTHDGTMYVKMLKAMYGCVQASLLWYKLLVKVLTRIGFSVSEVDRCVMRLVVGGIVNIILIYVDDLLVFATTEVMDLVLNTLRKRFTWITVERSVDQMSYLGIQLIWKSDMVIVDMKHYLAQILQDVRGLVRKSVLGGRETFAVTSGSDELGVEKASWYHTIIAKLLYLAKRARPDILTVVSFLCTRVTKPTVYDVKKLYDLLGYLHGTREKVLILRKQQHHPIEMYVDAAYGLHEKGELHSGTIILFGGVVVYVAS